MDHVALIVPTLNEAENIRPLLRQLAAVPIAIREIIFVDDESSDGTRDLITSWEGEPRARLIARTQGERGLAGAVIAGAESAAADVVVVMDADLSHPPEKIPALLGPVLTGQADLVIGSRYVPGGATPGWPAWRLLASRLASALAFPLTGVHDSMGGFFAVRRETLLRYGAGAIGFKIAFETIVRGRQQLKVREVPIVFRDRIRGTSKMSLREAVRFMMVWLTAIRRRPEPISPSVSPVQPPP